MIERIQDPDWSVNDRVKFVLVVVGSQSNPSERACPNDADEQATMAIAPKATDRGEFKVFTYLFDDQVVREGRFD